MKKALVFVVALLGIGMVLKRLGPMLGRIDWEKRLAAMPDNAPPKWMFSNVAAIRENTDRILALLEGGADMGSAGREPDDLETAESSGQG